MMSWGKKQTKAGITVSWLDSMIQTKFFVSMIQSNVRLTFYWKNSNKIKMPSNNAINTRVAWTQCYGLKFNSRQCLKIYLFNDFRQKECTNIIKGMFFNKVVELAIFKRPLITPGFSVALIPLFLLENLDTPFYDFSNIPTPYK